MSVPGIGVLTATALVAFVGEPRRFRSGRRFAAYLGLTPREHSSGLSRRLGRITKHGNSYLRMLLIHGARSALRAGRTAREPAQSIGSPRATFHRGQGTIRPLMGRRYDCNRPPLVHVPLADQRRSPDMLVRSRR
ncbi:MAG: transposase [Gemmatimonadota bacterium]